MPSPADPLPVKAEAYGIAYSHPTWMVERWLSRFGEQATLALLEANNRYRLLGQTLCQLSHKEDKAVGPPCDQVAWLERLYRHYTTHTSMRVMREKELKKLQQGKVPTS